MKKIFEEEKEEAANEEEYLAEPRVMAKLSSSVSGALQKQSGSPWSGDATSFAMFPVPHVTPVRGRLSRGLVDLYMYVATCVVSERFIVNTWV